MLESAVRRVWQRLYRSYAVRHGVRIGTAVHIGIGSILWAPRRLIVGDHVYIGKGCTIECDGSIGTGVLIANRVGLVGRDDHDIHAVGTYIRHAPWVGNLPERSRPLVIEDDVWIGYGAIVLSGVTVGRGAVVAAGAVVTSDVEPYSIVVGNPARHVSWRFTDAERQEHERLLLGGNAYT